MKREFCKGCTDEGSCPLMQISKTYDPHFLDKFTAIGCLAFSPKEEFSDESIEGN